MTASLLGVVVMLVSCSSDVGHTVIERWPDGKSAAVSITFDGGTINQFDIAVPVMDELGLPGTFFIVTGDIGGSQHRRTFIGRPVEDIAAEVIGGVPTTAQNFYERAGAVRVLPFREAIDFHTRAGDLFELGKTSEAYATIEEAYRQAAAGELTPVAPETTVENPDVDATWDDLRSVADRGHEIASHSVSHAQHAILDDENMRYELEESRDEILRHLGADHTFSVEVPYGTENERVMKRTLSLYPASRNRMPEEFLEEINRWTDTDPTLSELEYVQWQRGPKSTTSFDEMKSWIDHIATGDRVWLVLVFHGVEGIGWEPVGASDLEAYFRYIGSRDNLWVATFGDVTRYMRERMAASVAVSGGDELRVEVTHSLDPNLYDYPLTLTTQVPDSWEAAWVTQGSETTRVDAESRRGRAYVSYRAVPNAETVTLREAEAG